jgi:uncharacterized protein YdiU (UPF0061 family)
MEKQASLISKWVAVGFVHGVMNTDNMTISGETIDYGPCAFIDDYNPQAVFSSIDEQARYAFGNQPNIAQWNLARFAETLIPLIDSNDSDNAIKLATDELNQFPHLYQQYWLKEMQNKLGLAVLEESDIELINGLYEAIEGQSVDYTKLFRRLADAARGDKKGLLGLFEDSTGIETWLKNWLEQLSSNGNKLEEIADNMDTINPIYIPRNHLVEQSLQAASKQGDYEPFKKLLSVLMHPFEKRDGLQEYEEPASKESSPYVTFCGT